MIDMESDDQSLLEYQEREHYAQDDIVGWLRGLAEEHYEMLDNIHEPMTVAADEIERLRKELDTWKSVFPDIAPERVQPDRSKLEREIERLRTALRKISADSSIHVAEAIYIAQEALGEDG
jgi:uncharacterized coiled-coil DUF342 family protein